MALHMRKFRSLPLLLLSIGMPSIALAWPPDSAMELNFTSDILRKAWQKQENQLDTWNETGLEVQERFRNEVVKRCPDCQIQTLKDRYGIRKFRVTVPNTQGWYFEITLDPAVVEITSKPIQGVDKVAKQIDQLIFDVAKAISLRPGRISNLNHGVKESFGENTLLFKNYAVDFFNHVGISTGETFGAKDEANAPHPERLYPKQRRSLKRLLENFDASHHTIQEFSQQAVKEAFYNSPTYGGIDGEPGEKYHAYNISSAAREGESWPRVETRPVPMQTNAREIELWDQLFAARIKFLEGKTRPIPYIADQRYHRTPPLSAFEMVQEFHQYVTECGLGWGDYRGFVSKRARFQRALAKLEKELAKPRMKSAASCEKSFHAIKAKR